MVECTGVNVAFDGNRSILKDLSLSVSRGTILSLLGASGSGKSTLLKAIAGIVKFDQGEIRVAGRPVEEVPFDLAFVFQEPTLLPWRTVVQNIRLPLELGARGKGETVTELMQQVGLRQEDASKLPRQLSGGMRMRVSLARALITSPDLLLLDEPFAALDDMLRNRMHELLMDLWNRRQMTILFVTHNIAEAIFLSHRIAILKDGRIAEEIDIPLPFPRHRDLRGTAAFAECYQRVATAMESN